MESRSLKLGALSLLMAWAVLIVVGMAGGLVWDNRLLWVPPALLVASFVLATGSWDYEENRSPILIVSLAAVASLVLYAVGYVFLFVYSIPNRPV